MKIPEEEISEMVYYCGPLKMSYEGFCLDTFRKLMKECPEGSYLVMKIILGFPDDRPLMALRYKYNSRVFVWFISTQGGGSTEPGVPYLSRFPDNCSNVSICLAVHPLVLGNYFNACN